MPKIKIFSGTSNRPLAQKIAHGLDIRLGDAEITRFIDNECRVWVKEEAADVQRVYVVQSLSQIADQNLVELALLGQALKSLGAKHLTSIIPWLGYSKQDKQFRRGEAVSAQLVAKIIEASGFDALLTVELHSENLVPYFKIPVVEIATHDLLAETVKNPEKLVVVSPDRGGQSRSERFARRLGADIIYLDKKRDLETGKVTVTGISGMVKDKDIVIFDDIINTGSTAIRTAEFLKKHAARSIVFLATHAVLAGDACEQLQKSEIDRIIVTDTINTQAHKHLRKLEIVSVAPLILDKLKENS